MKDKPLTVLPNFVILAEAFNPAYSEIKSFLSQIAILESEPEHIHTYKINSQSVWSGLQSTSKDIIEELSKYSKQDIPNNVVTEIKNYETKMGVITLFDDCLLIKNKNLLKDILGHPVIKKHIDRVEDNMVYLNNFDFDLIKEIIEIEMGYPIKLHESKNKTYIIEFVHFISKEEFCYAVKSFDQFSAFKSLYKKYKRFNETNLRKELKIRRDDITQEDIERYMKVCYEKRDRDPRIKTHIRILPRVISSEPKPIFKRN